MINLHKHTLQVDWQGWPSQILAAESIAVGCPCRKSVLIAPLRLLVVECTFQAKGLGSFKFGRSVIRANL